LIKNVTPILPTTKSLAGTLTLADQFWIGKGVSPGGSTCLAATGIYLCQPD
jgi:hypothetical protein